MTLIEELLDLQVPQTIKISPNAQQVLYSTTVPHEAKKGDHVVSTLWLADTGHAKSSRQLTSGLYFDRAPAWSPDGNSIAFISDRAKPGESSAIYVLPLEVAGEAYPLTPTENEREIGYFEFSPDGNFIAYTSADEKTADKKAKEKGKDDAHVWGEDWPYSRLRIVHVATKKVTTLVSHDAHVVDLAWSPDGSKIAFGENRSPDGESADIDGTKFSIVDVSSREIKRLCTFPNETGCLTWAEDDAIHFIGGRTADSPVSSKMIYSIDLKSKQTQFARCAHGEEDCAVGMGKVGKDVTLLVQHGMEDQIRMLGGRVLFAKKKEILAWDAAFTSESDEMIIAVAQSDASCPDEVYTVTASGGALVQLSNHGAPVEDKQFGIANFLTCRLDDDKVDLDGVYVTPKSLRDKPSKPLPTIVIPHGGPYSRETETFNPSGDMWAPLLAHAGYGILFPNYRGGSGRGETFAAYARGGVGTVDYDDIITLTNHAINEGYADKDNLLVAGWSQGGFLSYLAAVRNGMHGHGWKFKAAIPGAGVSEWNTMVLTSDLGAFEAALAGRAPWECDANNISAPGKSALWEFKKAAAEGVVPPMLILHGEEDERVPLEQATGFRRALDSAGLPYEMVTYPREPHDFKERKHLVDMAERVLRFVDLHIGAGKA
jgi:dipeptidyl aminopeptidase/acylaminoacyl peptidase